MAWFVSAEGGTMSDAELVKAVLAGKIQGFDSLVKRYIGLARGLCSSHVRDRAAHDDLVQDSFVYAYTKLGTLRDPNRFGPWFYTIVRNQCRNWQRREQRSKAFDRTLAAEPRVQIATPEEAISADELRDWVGDQIARLPERTREAMFLCYVEGLEQKDAAAFLGISLSALKKRLQYGRKQISSRIWSTFDEMDRPQWDHKELAGAIMVSVRSITPPAATASVFGGLGALLLSKPGLAGIGIVLIAIATLFVQRSWIEDRPDLTSTQDANDTVALGSNETPDERPAITAQQSSPAPEFVSSYVNESGGLTNPQERLGITGVLVKEGTNETLPDVEVEYWGPTDRSGIDFLHSNLTSSDGTFAFPEIDPDTHFSLRLGWPHRFTMKPFSQTWGTGPQPDHFVLEARETGAITGHVRYPNGDPVPGAAILREYPFGNSRNRLQLTGDDGRFGFSQDGGIWRLKAEGRMGLESEPLVLDLYQGEVIEHDFVLPRGAAIHLTVETPPGYPAAEIENVNVKRVSSELLPTGNPKVAESNSGSAVFAKEGNQYSLLLVPEGRYTITLTSPGYSTATIGPIVVDDSLADQFAAVVLAPAEPEDPAPPRVDPRTVRVDETVPVIIRVQDALGNELNSLGTFTFSIDEWGNLVDEPFRLKPGAFWFAAVKEGYGADVQYRRFDEGSNTVTFTFADGGTIHGTVSSPDDRRLSVYPLDLWELNDRPTGNRAMKSEMRTLGNALSQGTRLDSENAFVLPPLSEGWYVVMTDSLTSEPVEVRSGHTTGPVHLAPTEIGDSGQIRVDDR